MNPSDRRRTTPATSGSSAAPNVDPETLAAAIRAAAGTAGITQLGFAPAVSPPGYHRLLEWLQQGHAGRMTWIDDRRAAYESPAGVMPGTVSVIAAAVNYHQQGLAAAGPRISRYARGPSDYHEVLKSQLQQIAAVIHQLRPAARTRIAVDTAPLLERDFGRLAGIGWFGRNTMLISRQYGSWFFLGAILTDQELPYDAATEQSWCGTCTRCLDACPTDAFPEPGVLDARRCVSYLTIELRDQPIPLALRTGVGEWLFGCDVCQDVCPWNRFAPADCDARYAPQEDIAGVDCRQLLQMTESDFRVRFRGTPLFRTGRNAILRNAAVVLGNRQDPSTIPDLSTALDDPSPLVRGAAAWALGRFQAATATAALRARRTTESDPQVTDEIDLALQTG